MSVGCTFLMCLVTTQLFALEAYKIGETFSVKSEILDEQRVVHVYLPASYYDFDIAPKMYPVIYAFDGEEKFHTYTGIVDFLSHSTSLSRRIPEFILVAIENTNKDRDLIPSHSVVDYFGEQDMDLQLSGGGNRFLDFIESELIPKIEGDYRALQLRVLIGESFAGLLSLHALVNRPAVFQSYIAIDPNFWWDGSKLAQQAQLAFKLNCPTNKSVFVATAKVPEGLPPESMRKGREIFQKALSACSDNQKGNYIFKHYINEDQSTVSVQALLNGLNALFSNYWPDFKMFAKEPTSILDHFEMLSKKMGGEFPPDETMMVHFGFYLLYQKQEAAKAITLFELNAQLFPNSANSLNNLAYVYSETGDIAKAKQLYQLNLLTFPNDETSAEQLGKLD